MIRADRLTKRFGPRAAVESVSFEVPRGQIAGFLGPNGAGKTTTMRLLTGFLPADAGRAEVMGLDVARRPLEARRALGYLPENNPLYDDLDVVETLELAARLRGLGARERRERIAYAVRVCGLQKELAKPAGALSKGYRQRLGLAQAILHDPPVLVLDEPTSGLDPNQIREVRELIAELGREKTVLLSTHILSEASELCSRLIIISAGRVAADGAPGQVEAAAAGRTRLYAALKAPPAEAREALSRLPGVAAVEPAGGPDGGFRLECATGADPREELFALAAQRRWPLLELRVERASLEDVFRELTR